jgi:hypothetical protein
MGSKGGSGGGSNQMGFQASTSTYTPNPEAMAAYRNSLGMAQNVSQIPYESYPGQMTAGFTPDQLAAFQGTREMQGMAQPYINAGAGLVNRAIDYSNPNNFNPAVLSQYYNPFQQNVINATQATMAQQNAQQQADLTARAIQQGAYGGDRSGVARAALMGQQALANQQVLSGLQSQGYQQAVNQFNQQQQQAISTAQTGAYSLGQLGLQGQQAALQGIQALLGTGGMQQQLGQQQLTAAYNQWLQERAYPYQQANFYSGIVSGIAPNMGGTTNTMGFGTGQTQQQQASGGGGGAGILSSALSFLPMLMGISDRDDKTDIEYLGRDPESGEKLYSYRYKGDPKSYPKVVGPMAQDIEKEDPDRVHEIGGHKIVEGLGHLKPSDREGRADGGSNIYSGQTVDPSAYQQSAYQADPRFDPGFQTGLNAVIDPAMADKIARQKWVSEQTQEQPAPVQEQLETRNPEFNLFPYFQDGAQNPSGFGSLDPEMKRSGGRVGMADGGVGGFGDLMKQKTPYGAAAPYVEALPITPGRDIGKSLTESASHSILSSLPGKVGAGSGGGGGGGQGGGGGMPKLPKMGKPSAGAAAGAEGSGSAQSAGQEEFPKSEANPDAQTPPERPADLAAPAPDVSATDTSAAPPPVESGGFGGLSDLLSGFGGMFGGFKDGGRVGYDGGGAAGSGDAASAVGGLGSLGDAFPGALGSGHAGLPGLIGESGTKTLGSSNLAAPIYAPTKGPMGDMTYGGWLNRAMQLDPGPQLTPEEQGQPSLPKTTSKMTPRPWMPGLSQSETQGNQNPGLDPGMMLMAGGKGAMGLALGTMIANQNAANDAKAQQAQLKQQRADILASPMDVGGYGQSLQSNIVNPHTGLFNVGYKAYYVPHYDKGGRVGRQDGGRRYSLGELMRPLATVETGGYKDPYSVIGPKSRHGDYPYGKYQVMGANIPSWGRAAGYQNLTPKQFLRDSDIQEKVAQAQFSKYLQQKGGNALEAARMWIGGPKYNPRSSDVLGTTPVSYSNKYAREAARLGINPRDLQKVALANQEAPVSIAKTTPVSLPETRPSVSAADRPPVQQSANAPSYMSAPPLPGTSPKPSFIEHPEQMVNQPSQLYLGPKNTAPALYTPSSQPVPSKGFSLAALNPIQPAMADDNGMARLPGSIVPSANYNPLQDRGVNAGLYPVPQLYKDAALSSDLDSSFPHTGIAGDPAGMGFRDEDISSPGFYMPNMSRDMAGVRPMGFGDLPLTPFSADEVPVSADDSIKPSKVAPVRHKAEHEEAPSRDKEEKFFGDYRDFEPWKSDPIGGFFDKLAGDVPSSDTKGASMYDVGGGETAPASLGDLGNLFNFSQGGFVRNGYEDGGTPESPFAKFSSEDIYGPPTEPAPGFDLASNNPPVDNTEEEVYAADRAAPRQPQPKPGFENLLQGRNLQGGKLEFGPLSQAMLAAGMGMMASDRVNPLQAIGEGGLRGLEYYQSAKAAENAAERQQIAQQNELSKLAETRRYHDLVAGKGSIGVIGYDAFGRPQYGWTTGPRAGMPRTSSEAAAASAGEVDWTKHGDDFLEQVPAEYHEQIKAIAEGRGALPAGFATGKNPLYKLVTTYDPGFNMGNYKRKSQALAEYGSTKPTTAGGQMIAANTGLAHLGEVSDAAQRLNNGPYRDYNWLSQAVRSHLPGGIPEVKEFEAAKELALTEISKFYKGGTPAEGEIRRELQNLDAAGTPQELNAVIGRLGKLMQGKSEALEHQWHNIMGKDAAIENPDLNLWSDPAKSSWQRIQDRAAGKSEKGVEALAKKYGMTVEQLQELYRKKKAGGQ